MSSEIPPDLRPLLEETRRHTQALFAGLVDWSSPRAPWLPPNTPGYPSARWVYMWRDSQRRFRRRREPSETL